MLFISFDRIQLKYVKGGFSRVGSSGSVKDHWAVDATLQNIIVDKNGYLFVYVSNESNFDVFFDNLQVVHKPGPVLEETHYYPYGLTMAGISANALKGSNYAENRLKYNGKELQNKEFGMGQALSGMIMERGCMISRLGDSIRRTGFLKSSWGSHRITTL